MKTIAAVIVLVLLPAFSCFGQLVAVGLETGVVTTFGAATDNQDLIITVDNTVAGSAGVTGSMTAFGFNTPFAAPLDLDHVALSYRILGANGPTTEWNPLSMFQLNAGGLGDWLVDLGAESDDNDNPNGNSVKNGIQFGEIVAFKFSFDGSAYPMPQLDGFAEFFNQDPAGLNFIVRWQDVVGSTAGSSDAFAGNWTGGYDIPQGGGVPEPSTYGLVSVIVILAVLGNRIPRRHSPK